MKPTLFEYPSSSKFGRMIPKTKLYAHGGAGARIKRLFVEQVERIRWSHKLSPETVKLKSTRSVPEIEILSVELKTPEVHMDVLRCIDQAIPFPTLLEIRFDTRIQLAAAFKRPSDAEKGKWVVGEHCLTDFISESSLDRIPLPVSLDLGTLYRGLLNPLMPFPANREEPLREWADRVAEFLRLERESLKLTSKIRKEKQFNRKVALQQELTALKGNQERLKSGRET